MARHGLCRCGFLLTFKRGSKGYKTRCPSCHCFVRLKRRKRRRRQPQLPTLTCVCGAVIVLDQQPPAQCPCCARELDLPRPPDPELPRENMPTRMLDLFEESRPPTPRPPAPPILCAACDAPLTTSADRCPKCGARRTPGAAAVPQIELHAWPGDEATPASPVRRALTAMRRAVLRLFVRRQSE